LKQIQFENNEINFDRKEIVEKNVEMNSYIQKLKVCMAELCFLVLIKLKFKLNLDDMKKIINNTEIEKNKDEQKSNKERINADYMKEEILQAKVIKCEYRYLSPYIEVY
jgi:hypothetical protein